MSRPFTFVTNRLQGSGVGTVLAIQATWMTRNGIDARVIATRPPARISGRPNPVTAVLRSAGVRVSELQAAGRGLLLRHAAQVARQTDRDGIIVGAGTIGALYAVIAKLLTGGRRRVIVEVHGDPDTYAAEFPRTVVSLTRRLFRHADLVTAVSPGLSDKMAGYYRVAPGKACWRPNPLALHEAVARSSAPTDLWLPDAPFLLGCGRLNESHKRWSDAIDAFHQSGLASSHTFLILGEGPDRARLEAQVTRLGLTQRVLMPGYTANPYAYMSRAVAFVLSSVTEGGPTVLYEAMACGLPIVSSDCRYGPPEILGHGRYGRLYPVGNVTALAEALREVARGGPDVLERVRLGRLRAAECDVEAVMPRIVRLYTDGPAALAN